MSLQIYKGPNTPQPGTKPKTLIHFGHGAQIEIVQEGEVSTYYLGKEKGMRILTVTIVTINPFTNFPVILVITSIYYRSIIGVLILFLLYPKIRPVKMF